MFDTFKGWFGNKEKGNYVWCILPEYFHLHVITKTEKNWLKKKKDIKKIDTWKFPGPVLTMATPQELRIKYKFNNNEYRKIYGCTSKFFLMEFDSKNKNFDDENVIFQIYKNNVPLKYFRVNLKNQKSKILLFSDFDTSINNDLVLLEKKIIILKASLICSKMIPYIIEEFEKSIFSYVKNNYHRETFQKFSKNFLERIFNSQLHIYLTNTNYGLFFSLLNCLKSLIKVYAKADPRFKTQFNLFRKKLEKYINSNCKKIIKTFHNFENETVDAEILSNDLTDILKQMYQCLSFDDTENFVNIMKNIDHEKLEIDSDDLQNILFYYFSIQRKIEINNNDQFKTFHNFTKEVNKFEGKKILIFRS